MAQDQQETRSGCRDHRGSSPFRGGWMEPGCCGIRKATRVAPAREEVSTARPLPAVADAKKGLLRNWRSRRKNGRLFLGRGGSSRSMMMRGILLLMCCNLAQADIPHALQGEWTTRARIEAELIAATMLVRQITVQIVDASRQAPWKGQQRLLFVNSGRAFGAADRTQQAILEN